MRLQRGARGRDTRADLLAMGFESVHGLPTVLKERRGESERSERRSVLRAASPNHRLLRSRWRRKQSPTYYGEGRLRAARTSAIRALTRAWNVASGRIAGATTGARILAANGPGPVSGTSWRNTSVRLAAPSRVACTKKLRNPVALLVSP